MAGQKMDERGNDPSLRSGSEGMVLLQRGNCKEYIWKNDTTRNERGSSSALPGRSGKGKTNLMVKFDIEGMTVGEILLTHRRRSGESQETVANKLGLTRNQYGSAERDQQDYVKPPYIPEVGKLEEHEKCFLLRRRFDLTQEEVAEKIGVTRFWVNQMELGKVSNEKLVKFWELLV